jgi:hypothetical protein
MPPKVTRRPQGIWLGLYPLKDAPQQARDEVPYGTRAPVWDAWKGVWVAQRTAVRRRDTYEMQWMGLETDAAREAWLLDLEAKAGTAHSLSNH